MPVVMNAPNSGSPKVGTRCRRKNWKAPLYWHRDSASGEWTVFTLRGRVPLVTLAATPVCHISYFEADAFARWSGKRLPTEAEWEIASAGVPVAGNLLRIRLAASRFDRPKFCNYGQCSASDVR